ncbi:hypothetical protein CYMTET_49941 [Cymbomonas tetramitiformis]|uniref:Probable pectate lyase C n=1 Tax=Cymbomonas tetramitiformis TaxID=36881 RepID=A0AAE0ETD5_9CHLO|nr:hypothetical protein CYMTET_49941 [Cymbomonas tetramitiformis]
MQSRTKLCLKVFLLFAITGRILTTAHSFSSGPPHPESLPLRVEALRNTFARLDSNQDGCVELVEFITWGLSGHYEDLGKPSTFKDDQTSRSEPVVTEDFLDREAQSARARLDARSLQELGNSSRPPSSPGGASSPYPSLPPAPPIAQIPPAPETPGEVDTNSVTITDNATAEALLREAIEDQSVSTIILQVERIQLNAALPIVTRELRILGECSGSLCIIDGQGSHRILTATSRRASLELYCVHLFRANNTVSGTGGGGLLVTDGARGRVEGCIVSDCTVDSDSGGGGVACTASGFLLLLDTVVRDNIVNNGLGGGGVLSSAAEVEIHRCLITRNRNYKCFGGAGLGVVSSGLMTVSESVVTENQDLDSLGGGGGLGMVSGNAIFRNSTISENNSSAIGGGIGSIFSPMSLIVENSHLYHNRATDGGGGIYGLYCNTSDSDGDPSNFTVSGTLFESNSAVQGAGLQVSLACSVQISSSTFLGNTAPNEGGAMYIYNARAWISDGMVFDSNDANTGGAIYITASSEVLIYGNVSILGNTAGSDGGGGMVVRLSVLTLRDGVVLSQNSALSDGGGMLLESSQLFMESSSMNSNHALFSGGGLGMRCSSLQMDNSVIESNHAMLTGGGINAELCESPTYIQMQSCLVASNSVGGAGGGAYLRVPSTILATQFVTNVALEAGGVAMFADTALSGGLLEGNAASVHGGGLMLFHGAHLSLQDTTARNNSAATGIGGAIYLMSLGNASNQTAWGSQAELRNVTLTGNRAPSFSGAAIGCNHALPSPFSLNLSLVNMTDNLALNGQCIYLMLSDNMPRVVEPYVEDCVCRYAGANASMFSTVAVSSALHQPLGVLAPASLELHSGEMVSPELVYAAFDFYGSLVQTLNNTLLVAVNASNEDASSPSLLELTSRYEFYEGGAAFDSLALNGGVGETYKLDFNPVGLCSESQNVDGEWDFWMSRSLRVTLHPCDPGETYSSGSETKCTPCAEGTVRFDNRSNECSSCLDTGLTCTGGNQFEVQVGQWLAVESATKACGDDDPQCVFDRVYSCNQEAPCTPEGGQPVSGSANSSVYISQAAQCGEGYDAAVPLCGRCLVGYARTVAGDCKGCPSPLLLSLTISGAVLFLVLLAVILWAVIRLNPSRFRSKVTEVCSTRVAGGMKRTARMSTTETTTETTGSNSAATSASTSIFFGMMQVSGQTIIVFDAAIIPNIYETFLRISAVFNFDLLSWLQISCVTYYLVDSNVTQSFYWRFAIQAVLTILIMIPLIRKLSPQTLRALFTKRSLIPLILDSGTGLEESKSVTNPNFYLAISMFILIQWHPILGTTMFQLFNCRYLHFDEAEAKPYLVLDHGVECFTNLWYLYAWIAATVIVLYIIGMPVAIACLLYHLDQCKWDAPGGAEDRGGARERDSIQDVSGDPHEEPMDAWEEKKEKKNLLSLSRSLSRRVDAGIDRDGESHTVTFQTPKHGSASAAGAGLEPMEQPFSLLDEERVQELLGILYIHYKREYYWFTPYDMMRRLAQTSAVIIVRMLDGAYATIYALLVAMLAMVFHTWLAPFEHSTNNFMQMLCLLSHCIVVLMLLVEEHVADGADSKFTGTLLVVLHTCLTIYLCFKIGKAYAATLHSIWEEVRKAGGKVSRRLMQSTSNIGAGTNETLAWVRNSFSGQSRASMLPASAGVSDPAQSRKAEEDDGESIMAKWSSMSDFGAMSSGAQFQMQPVFMVNPSYDSGMHGDSKGLKDSDPGIETDGSDKQSEEMESVTAQFERHPSKTRSSTALM